MTDLHEQSQTHNDGLLLAGGGEALMVPVDTGAGGWGGGGEDITENKYRATEVSAGTMTHG